MASVPALLRSSTDMLMFPFKLNDNTSNVTHMSCVNTQSQKCERTKMSARLRECLHVGIEDLLSRDVTFGHIR